MISLKNMLGTGLLKKEKKPKGSPRAGRKKVSVQTFLKKLLGTRLVEKKF